jgi:phosphomannomutase
MQQIDRSIFQEYDIRGIYPSEFNEDVAYRVARAFAVKLKPHLTIVGHDMRTSAQPLVEAVIRGLTDEGSDVTCIGMTSSPMFYYAVNALNADAGITVTASHNPEQYNGLKMTGPKAIPSIDYVSNDDLYTTANEANFGAPTNTGKVRETICPIDQYVEAVLKASGIRDCGGLKIAVDAGNGIQGIILPALFKTLNCEVTPLFWEPDGRFPNHEANPLKDETLDSLKKKVKELGANLGIAYDGDGDRVGFVDETDCHIPGDIMTAVMARQALKEKPGATVIYDVRSSRVVKEEIEKAGGTPLRWKVGHALIKEKMRESGAYFGGELSCHYYFSNFYITDNGDMAMLKVIQTILNEGKSLSELTDPIMRYFHSPEINSTVSDIPSKIEAIKERYKDGRIDELDGLTVDYDDWWFNLRPSHTEPLLRLNVEAKTEAGMKTKVSDLVELIRGTAPTDAELTPARCTR